MPNPKLVWLASYPKSGNTWFRAFISVLLGQVDLDLNRMKADLIFSSRKIFDFFTDTDSTYLTDDEVKELLPQIFQALSDESQVLRYIKVHDAFTFNKNNVPIIPVNATHSAIYIIRNPLDIAGSFASHAGLTVDETILMMNKPNASLGRNKNNLNIGGQFQQLLLTWSEHVGSWTNAPGFPTMVVRYEDLLSDPSEYFYKAVRFLGLDISQEQVDNAIHATSFEKLRLKEAEKGFLEKISTNSFFRAGKSGNWKSELTRDQVNAIVQHHQKAMEQYGYLFDL